MTLRRPAAIEPGSKVDEGLRARGRPPRAPLDVLRARTWYWAVRSRVPWTDYGLNYRFVGAFVHADSGTASPKAFDRIRRFGTVPSEGTHHARKFSLVDRVEAEFQLRGTASIFRSPFWQLLRDPHMDALSLKGMISDLLARQGLCRPNLLEAPPAVQANWFSGPSDSYKAGIDHLIATCTLDSVALLGALFREALLFGELDLALVLKPSYQDSVCAYWEKMREYADLSHLAKYKETIFQDARFLRDAAIDRVLYTPDGMAGINLIDDVRGPIFPDM